MQYFISEKHCRFELLTWHKTNPIPTCNNKYLSDTEYCLLFRGENTRIGGTMETKKKYYISEINKKDKELYLHPTCKPLEFVKNHIFNSTKEGDIVLDTFCGSATSLAAAKELNRHYLGFEINPEYYKIAVDRLNGLSQKDRKRKDLGILDMFDFGVEIND